MYGVQAILRLFIVSNDSKTWDLAVYEVQVIVLSLLLQPFLGLCGVWNTGIGFL